VVGVVKSQLQSSLVYPKPTNSIAEVEPSLMWSPAVLAGAHSRTCLVAFLLLCLLFVAVQVVASYMLSPAVLAGVQGSG
jgi:hypothetical protein